tara:strand:+ start:233 stop:376 length:144 start_codon:yes stop_codon:yes gene_type:complete
VNSYHVIKNRKIRERIVEFGHISKKYFASLQKHQDNIPYISKTLNNI